MYKLQQLLVNLKNLLIFKAFTSEIFTTFIL